MTAVRSRIGGRRGGAGIALVLLAGIAGLAGCSSGSGTAASPATGESATPAPPTAGTSATPSMTPSSTTSSATPAGTSAPATKVTGASAPVLPSRAGSPPIPWDTTTATVNAPQPTSVPSRTSGPAQLTVTLDDGTGVRSTWTLTCQPPGGDHPDPTKACGVLGANGDKAFRPTPPDVACSQVYGGPQKALVRGTWRGKAVSAQFDLENGCEVARWNLLLGLLPPGGLP